MVVVDSLIVNGLDRIEEYAVTGAVVLAHSLVNKPKASSVCCVLRQPSKRPIYAIDFRYREAIPYCGGLSGRLHTQPFYIFIARNIGHSRGVAVAYTVDRNIFFV